MGITSYPTADAFGFSQNRACSYLRWSNTVFLYLCVIHRYFQTTGRWVAKLVSKVQVQLKKIILIRLIGLSNVAMATQLAINKY